MPPLSRPVLVRHGTLGWIFGPSLNPGSAPPLLYSADDGLHWSNLSSPCPDSSNASLAPTQTGHLWMVCGGEPGAGQQGKSVYRSSDNGRHWQLMAATSIGSTSSTGRITSGGYVGPLAAASDQRAWLGLNRGGLVSTVDGGVSWGEQSSFPPPEDFFAGLQFIGDRIGWAAVTTDTLGGNGIYRTVDAGATWTHAPLP